MGWTIQHLDTPSTNAYRFVGAALDAAADALPPKQAAALDILREPRTDAWFETTPRQAAAIAAALTVAAGRMRWKPRYRKYLEFIRELIVAADTAAKSRRPWRWR